ncbi:hypothetical protein PUN28_004597 [Cardiocondyla obscurior]|uniref:Uncharacterized protein n=1 Tax=Cardiocondyla obscurior TaxID=286306 RepID=A0AAW2GFJ7_9HYME
MRTRSTSASLGSRLVFRQSARRSTTDSRVLQEVSRTCNDDIGRRLGALSRFSSRLSSVRETLRPGCGDRDGLDTKRARSSLTVTLALVLYPATGTF